MITITFTRARLLAAFATALGLLTSAALVTGLSGCSNANSAAATVPVSTVTVPTYTLTVASINPATGVAVTAAPADKNGVAGGTTAAAALTLSYSSGTSVAITAPLMAGAQIFSGWTGCTQAQGLVCTELVSANATLTANYITNANTSEYTLTVNSTNPSSGVAFTAAPADVSGLVGGATTQQLSYFAGTSVKLTAPAMAGTQVFVGWLGCTSTAGQVCTETMSANATVTAVYNISAVVPYTLTVNSTDPASGLPVTTYPVDNQGLSGGATSLKLSYNTGSSVILTAPAMSGLEVFNNWTGCTSTSGMTCNVLVNGNTTVTANYQSSVAITLTPGSPVAVTTGSNVQFTSTVTGSTNTKVAYTLSLPAGSTSTAALGTISSTGLYQTPYPAPASVILTATSAADPQSTTSATINITAPALATGPALTVDTSAVTHAISPMVYGMNNYSLAASLQSKLLIPVDRWGGDFTTRYNYQLDISNSAYDYYFENSFNSNTAYPDVSQFNSQVVQDKQDGSKTLVSVPMIGYTTKRLKACSYSVTKYGAQKVVDPFNADCGQGILANGSQIKNDPTDTSMTIDQTFVAAWAKYLVGKFNTAANGGVSIYQLDNEPEYYSAVHKDVHPNPMTYDEITTKGIAYAQVIKAADPTAVVSGPTISNFGNYFYSALDNSAGYSTGPCYCYNANPVDRMAHGNVPLLAYYLQQMKAAQTSGGTRLLDYLDLHTYFAAQGAAFMPAGDTALQAARLNSTRVFWDASYTDPSYTDPNIVSKAPAYPPQLIPFMQQLISANYPGTKAAITEYNWGGQESINGAVAQADILGIFGKFSLDMGLLWGPPDPVAQVPGVEAFQIFQNYDGNNSKFGDGSLNATTADQSKLSIYASKRTLDNAYTILVLNKTFGDLSSTITLQTLAGTAQAYQYSNANLAQIVALAAQPVTTVSGGGGTITATFPAQSITMFVLAK